ncbi:MAG: aminotransferase class III-fold pyridoxal phosphate-dependent enzyme [Bacteroidetes bacterium]|nr:aminotransferase class III-fold pyridoxal phosphate-dependent enzyme [Bacteroidota bacterium]
MTTDETIALEHTLEIPTYNKMPMALVRGEGRYVYDADGAAYLDFYGGHCVCILGHCPPKVVRAVQRQAAELMFYSNVAHSPVRAAAAQAVVSRAPDVLGNVFFANSGSEANETALKLARTYTGRSEVVALSGGFHGRTLGALATTHKPAYRQPYLDVLPQTHFAPHGDVAAIADLLSSGDVAAVIVEAIQSIAGMRMAPVDYIRQLRDLCTNHGTALIFDEVQTGVGRTGTFSISEHYGVTPDLITMAKSLGAGVPVSAVLVHDDIAATVESGDQGSTFGGGMLAMAAVKATVDQIVDDGLMARAEAIHSHLANHVGPMVAEVRGKGCLIGLALDRPVAPVIDGLRERGVLVGGSADPHVMRLMPPLTTTDAEIESFAMALEASLDAVQAAGVA